MGLHGRPHFAQRAMDGVEAPADGVVTGWGDVDGRPCCIAAYDFTVMAGSMGMTGELKVTRLREMALSKRMPFDLAARLGRRPHPGGGRLALRRLRPPLPRGGRNVGRDPDGRGDDGPLRRRHRLHPGPLGLRADGLRAGRDGARRPAPDQSGDRRGHLDGGARRRQGPLPQVGGRRPRGQGRRGMHREGQAVPLLLPAQLRGEAAGPRDRGPGRPHVGEADGDRPRLLAPALRHVRRDPRDRRRRRVVRHQAEVRQDADHLLRPLRRPAGRDRRQPAQAAGRDPRQRLGRQGGALHQPLRRLQHPARLPPGRARLHGRLEGRARRDHPPRGEDALRGQPRHGAEGDGDRPQGLRRRLLRDVRQGLRARPDRRLAGCRDLGDGRRGRGRNHRPLGDRGLRGPGGDPRDDAERGPPADRPLHRRRQRGRSTTSSTRARRGRRSSRRCAWRRPNTSRSPRNDMG